MTTPPPTAGVPDALAGARALGAAVDATDAAVMGYGLVGSHLVDGQQRAQARADEKGHRELRDRLLAVLDVLGLAYAPSGPGAALPTRIADDLSARRLATQLEDAAAASWRALLAASLRAEADPQGTAGAARLALDALAGCAQRSYRWRAIDTPENATSPFPGITG